MASPLTANSDATIIAAPILQSNSDATIIDGPTLVAASDATIGLPSIFATSDATIGFAILSASSDAEIIGTPILSASSDASIIDPPPAPPPPPPDGTFVPPGPPPEPPTVVRAFFNSGNCNINDCFPCNVLPTINASAEAPDVFSDFVQTWGNPWINEPKLGTLFKANGCQTICESTISQEQAFLCAERQQVQCMKQNQTADPQPQPVCLTPPCDGGFAPPPTPEIPPVEDFGNAQQSCDASCPDGAPFTFAVPAGSFLAFDQVTADRMAKSYACRQAQFQNTCLNLVTPLLCQDIPTAIVMVATGSSLSPTSNTWQLVFGSLPAGFSMGTITEGTTLVLSGTPTATGDSTFIIRVTAPNGNFAERTFTITVASITPADPELPGLAIGTPYSVQFAIAGATIVDPMWTISAGDVPDGLDLDNSTGELSGTPTEQGDFTFTVTVSSGTASSTTFNCEKEFHIGGCFIDASPNINLLTGTTWVGNSGGLISYGDFSVSPTEGWYYLNHTFQQNPVVLGFGPNVLNVACAAGRYITGTEDNGGPQRNFWIDVVTLDVFDLGDGAISNPFSINNNGDVGLGSGGSGSFIWTAATNTFSINLFTADGFFLNAINDSRAAVGIKNVPQQHAFFRSAAGVYADVHPAPSGALITSIPGTGSNVSRKIINASGHCVGTFQNLNVGTPVRLWAKLSGATFYLTAGNVAGFNNVMINDSDQITWDDAGTGHVFFYDGGITVDLGNLGFVKGINSAGVVVGNDAGSTVAWIYSDGVVSNLIDKMPTAVADGWTSILAVVDISDNNFVTGVGIQSGTPTIFVAKLCL